MPADLLLTVRRFFFVQVFSTSARAQKVAAATSCTSSGTRGTNSTKPISTFSPRRVRTATIVTSHRRHAPIVTVIGRHARRPAEITRHRGVADDVTDLGRGRGQDGEGQGVWIATGTGRPAGVRGKTRGRHVTIGSDHDLATTMTAENRRHLRRE